MKIIVIALCFLPQMPLQLVAGQHLILERCIMSKVHFCLITLYIPVQYTSFSVCYM